MTNTVVRYKRKNIAQQVNQTFAFCHKGLSRSKDDQLGFYTHFLTSSSSWMASLINVNWSEPSKWCLKSTILRKLNYQLDLLYFFFLTDCLATNYRISGCFRVSHNLRKWRKCTTFIYASEIFLRITNVLLANNTGYNFWVLNVLR